MMQEKEWTLFFYINGNNELMPEMNQLKSTIEQSISNSNINLVIQFGKIARDVIQIITPNKIINHSEENNEGVNRYIIKNNHANLIEALGPVNMAHPQTLYHFIEWGIMHYPASKYMVIIGGHGWQLIGTCADYTGDKPYLMGYPEMSNVFYQLNHALNLTIELLILDICYVNYIETIYEFGKINPSPINYLLTYNIQGPIQGLPYSELINLIQSSSKTDSLTFIKHFINQHADLDLVCFKISAPILITIKQLINEIAILYASSTYSKQLPITDIIQKPNPLTPWYKQLIQLFSLLNTLIITSNNQSKLSHITINAKLISDTEKVTLYCRNNFTKSNHWTSIISDYHLFNEFSNYNLDMTDMIEMSSLLLYRAISLSNPTHSENQKATIYQSLIDYKKWNYLN